MAKLLFLGTGGSSGVPMIACSCPVCKSEDPKNKRLRPSALLTHQSKNYLIDVGPDFRYQALHYGINDLEGVLITHTHFDHIAGIDDLRSFYLIHRKRLPVLVSETTLSELKRRYDYLFIKKEKGLAAQLDFETLKEKSGKMIFQGLPLSYVSYFQAEMEVNGFRFGSLAYISDINVYDESIFDELKGLDILVLSALRGGVSPVHFNFEEAIRFSKRVASKKTYFMHLSHEVDYKVIERELPEEIRIAYDGLQVNFEI